MSRKSRKRNRTTAVKNEVNKMDNFVEKNKDGSAATWTEMRQMAVGSLEIDEKYQRGLNIDEQEGEVKEALCLHRHHLRAPPT